MTASDPQGEGRAESGEVSSLLKNGASAVCFSFFISFSFRLPEKKMAMKKEKKMQKPESRGISTGC
jgi:hypothetical protein